MTATIRALYIGSDGGGAEALSTADLEVIPAVSGIDAMKRLQDDRVDCVVATTDLTDMPVGQFVSMVREKQPAMPVVLVSNEAEDSGVIDALDAGAETVVTGRDTGAVRKRIRDVVTSNRLDRAIEENERLKEAIREIATSTATLTDRVDIEEAIYDAIMNADLYEFLWLGDFQDESIAIRYPIEGDFAVEEIVSLVGGDDSSFIERAVTEGTVQTTHGTAETRSATADRPGVDVIRTPTMATDGSAMQPSMASAAVPLTTGGDLPDVLLLATTRPSAFDGSEVDLLQDLGQVAAAALRPLARSTETDVDETDRAKRFAESLAHELRSPIGIASTYLELGRAENDEESLDRAESALGRVEQTVDSILDIARHDGVEQPMDAPLDEDVEAAWESLDNHDAELILEGTMSLTGDHRMIVRALANLFRNAVVHGPESVTVRVGPMNGGFYVEDDGPGIPLDRREQVFDWGYSTADNGTGIGLSLVKEIVDLHGWSITIAEGDAGGARFEITVSDSGTA